MKKKTEPKLKPVYIKEQPKTSGIFCWHKWGMWELVEVETWKSFLPEQSSAYGIYMQATSNYSGPAGQFIKHNMQQRECTKCGKIQRDNV